MGAVLALTMRGENKIWDKDDVKDEGDTDNKN